MVTTYSRVWINRVRLPILLVVSCTGKMNVPLSPYVPENLVSRDGFSRPVPRQPAHLHTQAESGAFLRDSSRVPRRRPFMKPPYAIGSVPSLWGHAIAYRWHSLPCRESAGTGPVYLKVVSNECCLGRSPCVYVCVFFPSILDIKFVGHTSRGHTGGRSHGPINMNVYFPHALLVRSGHDEITGSAGDGINTKHIYL